MSVQWIKMTDPNGDPVWLNPEKCGRVRPAVGFGEEAKSIIDGDFGPQAVTETVEMAMKMIHKC